MGTMNIYLSTEAENAIKRKASSNNESVSAYCRRILTEGEEVKPLDRVELNDKIATLGEFIVNMSSALGSVSKSLEGLQSKVEALEQAQSADLNKIADTSAKLNSNMNELIKVQTLNQHQMLKELGMSTCILEAFISISTKSESSSDAWIDKMMKKAFDIFNERYLAPKQEGD